MVVDDIGDAIQLRHVASKGRSGRIILLNSDLKKALIAFRRSNELKGTLPYVGTTERSVRTSARAVALMFGKWYRSLGLSGCSSHSGRRTFVTNAARKISTVGG